MAKEKKPLIAIVSAPSGSGKTTVINLLLKEMEGIERSVSYTTREPRKDEQNSEDYIFIPEEEFIQKIEEGKFLEWEQTFGNYYGTLMETFNRIVDQGKDVILSIDVKGARNVKKEFPGSISIFLMPPSKEELESRLRSRRTDEEEQVSIRLKESNREMTAADEYDYLVVNKDIKKTVEDLKAIIEQARKHTSEGEEE